ncbi:MAG: AAA family ATPase [Clostridia bacterium]|nr:AAA family ATPase [Clostridia bacterium]
MRIDKLKINGFGKIKDKELEFSNGINLVFGENEAGKSSLLKFITSMLYGVSKNKNGKEISDFDRFNPWKSDEYSGKITYTLDDGKTYEIYREFKKKNPVIYDSNKEDISKSYHVDKNGIDFFYDQTKIDEETFYNTAITEQDGIRLSKSSQASIVQKITNLISSGDGNISYSKAASKIAKEQLEKVGTERTVQKPINNVLTRLKNMEERKRVIESSKTSISEQFNKEERLIEELDQLENERRMLREVQNKVNNKSIKNAEINFNRNLEEEYSSKIKELNEKIVNSDIENKKTRGLIKYLVIFGVMAFIWIIVALLKVSNIIKYLFAIPTLISLLMASVKIREVRSINSKAVQADRDKILNEINILSKEMEEKKSEAEKKEHEYNETFEKEKLDIIEKYNTLIDEDYIISIFNMTYDELLKEIDKKETRIQTINFNLHAIRLEIKMLQEKEENLSSIQEEIDDLNAEKEELHELNNAYNLAKECLDEAYKEVKSNISPKFIESLSSIIKKISNDRYNNVQFNDETGLKVEIENGKYIPASRLSVGTVDQMYLSLRLSALDEISKENLPIILDEAFAYFDNERLRSMLRYLDMNYGNTQVIIFTCSDREREILDELKLAYNYIKLEK